jgi:hypothetical protein
MQAAHHLCTHFVNVDDGHVNDESTRTRVHVMRRLCLAAARPLVHAHTVQSTTDSGAVARSEQHVDEVIDDNSDEEQLGIDPDDARKAHKHEEQQPTAIENGHDARAGNRSNTKGRVIERVYCDWYTCSFTEKVSSKMGNDMAITFADAVHGIFDNEDEEDEQGEVESDHDTTIASFVDGEDACEIVLD